MIFRIALRNLQRNPRRTLITLAAISMNTGILIVCIALLFGFIKGTLSNATNLIVGEAQIHQPNFLKEKSLHQTLEDAETIAARFRERGIAAAPRMLGYGLLSQGTKSAGALFWGVDPRAEIESFDLWKHMAAGNYLSEKPGWQIVLGKKIAKSLAVGVGDEVIIVVQAADGSLGNEMAFVSGILKSSSEELDRSAAFLHFRDFDQLFAMNGRFHEIALNSKGRLSLSQIREIHETIAPSLEFKTWQDLLPMVSDMVNVVRLTLWIFGGIFFLVAAIGVLNTMLMATFERIREFGLQKALGAPWYRMMAEVSMEALLMAFLATLVGNLIAFAAGVYLQEYGINLGRFGGETSLGGIAFDPVWKATLEVSFFVWPTLLMWIICFFASLYPASIAARLNPVESMQHV